MDGLIERRGGGQDGTLGGSLGFGSCAVAESLLISGKFIQSSFTMGVASDSG